MSKFKILIASLIIGSSSVALADTNFSFNASAQTSWGTQAPMVRDHRITTSYRPARPVARGTWLSLAAPTSGNAHLRLQSQAQLAQIRIQSATGSSFISTVSVRFADGTRQMLTFNRWIDARNPMLQFNLDKSARVDRISVNGSAYGRRGSYQVFGYGTQVAEQPMPPVYQPPVYQPPVYQPPMVSLAQGLNFYGTSGKKYLGVGADKGRFSTIRVQGLTGQTFIDRIEVNFTNGYIQTLDAIDRNLFAGQSVDIPLDAAGGNSVSQLVVFTNNGSTPVNVVTGEISISAF